MTDDVPHYRLSAQAIDEIKDITRSEKFKSDLYALISAKGLTILSSLTEEAKRLTINRFYATQKQSFVTCNQTYALDEAFGPKTLPNELFDMLVCGTLSVFAQGKVDFASLYSARPAERVKQLPSIILQMTQLIRGFDGNDAPWARDLRFSYGRVKAVQQLEAMKLLFLTNEKKPANPVKPAVSSKFDTRSLQNISIQEAESHLNNLFGFSEIKKDIERLRRGALDSKHEGSISSGRMNNFILSGPPGVGKTTLSKTIAEILAADGVLREKKITFVPAQQLLGQYIGHTEQNVRDAVKEGRGGLIVIDEFDTLAEDDNTSFEQAAINTINGEIGRENDNNTGTIFVITGYSMGISALLNRNAGLSSRFPNHFKIQAYAEKDLCKIIDQKAKDQGFLITAPALTSVETLLNKMKTVMGENFGNVRAAETILGLMIDAKREFLGTDYLRDVADKKISAEQYNADKKMLEASSVPSFQTGTKSLTMAQIPPIPSPKASPERRVVTFPTSKPGSLDR